MRLIDADALMEDLKQSHDWLIKIYEGLLFETEKRICSAEIATFDEIGLRIKAAPTIDAEPVRHGRWIKTCVPDVYMCSCCKRPTKMDELCKSLTLRDYCPNCGAKMDLE